MIGATVEPALADEEDSEVAIGAIGVTDGATRALGKSSIRTNTIAPVSVVTQTEEEESSRGTAATYFEEKVLDADSNSCGRDDPPGTNTV